MSSASSTPQPQQDLEHRVETSALRETLQFLDMVFVPGGSVRLARRGLRDRAPPASRCADVAMRMGLYAACVYGEAARLYLYGAAYLCATG